MYNKHRRVQIMETLATELLKELKNSAKRWFIAFCVMTGLELCTIAGFMWYISLPTEEYSIQQEADDKSLNILNEGTYYGSEAESDKEAQNDSEQEKKVMAKKFGPTIKKLQRAINEKYQENILINKTQFVAESDGKIIEMLIVKKAIWDENKKKMKNIEIFSSTSDVQIVLFLRDYWYELNGWEVPTDNESWNKAKRKYMEKHGNGQYRFKWK